MKKILITLAALATIAACNKAEVVEAPKGDAIAFGDAFVDNATKAIYETAANVQGFSVWGNVKGTNETPLALYPEAGAVVTRNGAALGAAWTCSVARYWTPSASYNFTAIENGTGTDIVNGIPTKISYTLNGADPADLIYGTATVETDEACVPSVDSGDDKDEIEIVSFTMQHLLARVKVSFQNKIEGGDYTYAISNVTLTTWDKGVYTIAPAEGKTPWALTAETNTVALSYASINSLEYNSTTPTDAGAQVLIPGAPMTLRFTYELKLKGSNGEATTIYTETVTKDDIAVTLEQGHSYSLNVQLQAGGKIDFTITDGGLNAWTDSGSTNI